MPDIDALMQEWPAEMEDMLGQLRLPNADLDLELDDYASLVCGQCLFLLLLFAENKSEGHG